MYSLIDARRAVLLVAALSAICAPGSAVARDESASTCQRTVSADQDLQAVIDSLPDDESPLTVCLAPGEHVVPRMVTIERSGVTLRGAADGTTLRMRAGVSSPVLVLGDAHSEKPRFRVADLVIENLSVIGGGESEREFYAALPYLSNSAIIVRSGDRVRLEDLVVNHCRSACLLTEHDSRNVLIKGNTVSGAQWDGISLNRAGPTRVIDNTIRDNVAAGITVEHLHGGEVNGNRIEANGSHGIYLAHAIDNVFRGNQFVGNHLAGVYLTCSIRYRDPVRCWPDSMSRDNRFEGNRFRGNRFGYQVAADGAANCREHEAPVNLSVADRFHNSGGERPAPAVYGDCLDYRRSRWSRWRPDHAPSRPATSADGAHGRVIARTED